MNQLCLDLFQLVGNMQYETGCGIPVRVSLQMPQGRWGGQVIIKICGLSRRQISPKFTAV